MKLTRTLLLLPLCSLLSSPLAADDPVDHYAGEPSETLADAVQNFTEGNARLRELLSGEVSNQDMADIHELSYTLENAVATLRREMNVLAVVLEDVHLASESFNQDTVSASGKAYLDMADTLEALGDAD